MYKAKDTRKVWLIAHPVHQYNEDVKDLARRENLKIIDLKFKPSIDPKLLVEKAPKLTFKNEAKPEVKEVKEVKK